MLLYTCAGCALEAEHQLLEMKVLGREPDTQLCCFLTLALSRLNHSRK